MGTDGRTPGRKSQLLCLPSLRGSTKTDCSNRQTITISILKFLAENRGYCKRICLALRMRVFNVFSILYSPLKPGYLNLCPVNKFKGYTLEIPIGTSPIIMCRRNRAMLNKASGKCDVNGSSYK